MSKQRPQKWEQTYQVYLAEFKALEKAAPLTTEDALRLGGGQLEILMREHLRQEHYSAEWLGQIQDLSDRVDAQFTEIESGTSDELYDHYLALQGDIRQINPATCLKQSHGLTGSQPDTSADQLAQGATLCQLF